MTIDSEADKALREHICYLLDGGGAHIDFRGAVAAFPNEIVNAKVGALPYTPWQVLEHMRIAQWDILEFSRNARNVSPKFPQGYWPSSSVKADEKMWRDTIEQFTRDLAEMIELVKAPDTDLFARIPHGDGQTILREALLVADHNAYHLGSLMTMKKVRTGT